MKHRSQVSAFTTYPRLDVAELVRGCARTAQARGCGEHGEAVRTPADDAGRTQAGFCTRGSSAIEQMHNRFVELGLRGMEPAAKRYWTPLRQRCGEEEGARRGLSNGSRMRRGFRERTSIRRSCPNGANSASRSLLAHYRNCRTSFRLMPGFS